MSSLQKEDEERDEDNWKSRRHKIIVLDDKSLGHEASLLCGPFSQFLQLPADSDK